MRIDEVMIEGRRLRISRGGRGPTLIFLHGYPENLRLWDRSTKLLSDHFDCIAIDWPGMGESEEWPGGATPKLMAERLNKILTFLEISRSTLVATDMGAQAALEFASRFGEKLDRLVVMNSLVFGDEETSWEINLLRRYGFNRWLLRNFPRLIFSRAKRTFMNSGEEVDKDILADFWKSFRRVSTRKFISKMCAGYQGALPKLPERYLLIQVPTLILWAESDAHFPPQMGRRLAEQIANARFDLITGAGHWMPWTHSDLVAEKIKAFQQGIGDPTNPPRLSNQSG